MQLSKEKLTASTLLLLDDPDGNLLKLKEVYANEARLLI
jgi:hypothetical protein